MSATQQWAHPVTGAPMLRLVHSSGDPYMKDHGGGRLTQIHIGDTLQFFNRTAGVLLSERTVRNISFDDGPADPEAGSGEKKNGHILFSLLRCITTANFLQKMALRRSNLQNCPENNRKSQVLGDYAIRSNLLFPQ